MVRISTLEILSTTGGTRIVLKKKASRWVCQPAPLQVKLALHGDVKACFLTTEKLNNKVVLAMSLIL